MSNVATLPQKQSFSLTPQTLEEAMQFASMMSKSNIVPKDYQGNPGNVLVAVQWGMELGLQPLQAMQNIAVINGRPSIWGDAMLAIVRGSGLLESIKEDISETGAVCTIKRRGEDAVSREFTIEDAKRAGLYGKQGPWQQHPKRMMQMRARAFALRDVFPDVLRGVHIAEEARDMPVEKDMGAAEVVDTPQAPAASKTESMRNKVAAKLGKAGEGVTLDSVLKAIEAAHNNADLTKAAEQAVKLGNDEDKAKARAAYSEKLAELKRATAQPNPEAGEIHGPDDEALRQVEQGGAGADPVMTYAQVADKLQKATNEDQLAEAADLIRYVGSTTQRDELGGIYKRKADEFKAAK
jgi:hypothetical protein